MSSGIGTLTTLIKRLEAATSRLEDIVIAQTGEHGEVEGTPAPGESKSEATQIEAAATAPAAAPAEAPAPAPAPTPASAGAASYLTAWESDVMQAYSAYLSASESVAPLVSEHAALVGQALVEVKRILEHASACRKPDQGPNSAAFVEYLEPLQSAIKRVIEFREAHRSDKALFNHLSTVCEGISALGWVAVEPTPGPYINDMKESTQFYANRVIKEHKGVNENHVAWVRTFLALLDAMKTYVMTHHRTGLAWNTKGQELSSYQSAGAAPPPPPPPPPSVLPPLAASASGGGMDAVFNQINQGEGITSALRKVDKSQMTHKNPELRASSIAAPTRPSPSAKPASFGAKNRGPPRKELDGNKWNVENFENEPHLVIDGTDIGHTVNIFRCDHCVIEIKGKVNAVSMLSCTKTSVLIDSLVSSLEVTRCTSFAAQVTGYTPTVLIDSTDGGQVYLSLKGLETDIITAKSSALNVSVPAASGEEGVLEEIPLPEQLKHRLHRSGTRTEAHSDVVQHAG